MIREWFRRNISAKDPYGSYYTSDFDRGYRYFDSAEEPFEESVQSESVSV